MKKSCLILICFVLSTLSVFAQQGKDGAASITTSTVVNLYTPITANVAAGSTSIPVLSTAGFSAGDLIYIVQMQGAFVNAYVYEWGNPNNALPNDTSFGKIKAYNGAGNNEFAEITSITGNSITLDCALKDSFGLNGKTQVIRVPRYSSLTLSGAGQITCTAWNGSIGGIVAIEVQGNTSLGNGTSINVAGKGFRGGNVLNATGFGATNTGANYGTPGSNNGAHKGESIAGDTNIYYHNNNLTPYYNNNAFAYAYSTPLTICKGNVANGGGGGNGNNCGGGGGSNGGVVANWNGMGNPDNSTPNNVTAWSKEPAAPVNGTFRPTSSSGGGRGGYSFSDLNADPTLYGPGSTANWGTHGDGRHNDGGWGGIPLDYSSGRIFLGGGGGAGDSNDGNGTSGANGGGIVYLLSYGTVSGAGQIIADGANAASTNGATRTFDENPALGDDGAGGGGGGYVFTTNAVSGTNVSGGKNGTTNGINNTLIATKFPPNGSTAGGAGSVVVNNPSYYLSTTNYTVCASSSVSLSVTVNGTAPSGLAFSWYTVAVGGTAVSNSNPYNITTPAAAGTYTFYAGTCPGTYRLPVLVTVTSASGPVLSISASNTVTCPGTAVTLTVSGASSYTWDANAGNANTSVVSVSPSSNTTYSVSGSTVGSCAGTGTTSIAITVSPSPTINITPSTSSVCAGSSATLTASGATSYSWSPASGLSATTGSLVIATPTATTSYTVSGSNGACSATNTCSVVVNALPSLTVTPGTACAGSSATLTASGANTYTWSPATGLSATTGSAVVANPTVTTTYTINGTNANNCTSGTTTTMSVVSNPAISVNSASLCAGSSATLTASGATSYSWTSTNGLSSGTGSTVVASPSVTSTYTVSGSVGSCTASPAVSTVTVYSIPSFSISNSNPVVCKGDSSKLSIVPSGTTTATYTWSPASGLSATSGTLVSAGPANSTTYSVLASSPAGCTNNQTSTVTVHTVSPLAIAASSTLACSGGTTTLTTNPGLQVYTWLPATAISGSTNTATVVASPVAPLTNYSVTGQDAFGCHADTATITISVISLSVTASSNSPVCQGGTLSLNGSNAGPGVVYTWTGPNSYSVSGSTPAVSQTNVNTAGIYTLSVSANGCQVSNTTSVSVTSLPVFTVNSATVCSASGSLSATLTASGNAST